ncbi:transcription regulator HTH, apses-type DNA-binding domain-containing protein [Calycina marina]|uniref:Transcription regulator HTH, apses-type DNA-binding domain-containing protein n=1 Tax=Calycina marina TaxID=1763456 RepID=A0A9P7ZAD0_9HELO|nr:transcription regulator HTH, apses-type DNA-binding domain-containing protein [Calycina marina]
MIKDGAVFAKGKVKGEVNYPPFEQFDEETMCEIQKFKVYPLGDIQNYCRHIPYNSEKKSFLDKTGRESFEVFQYIFKIPGEDKDYTVMWDYNIGLVRITPFFKCLKHTKTMPAKMLNLNPGLKDITHSITGGALAAQGYWMPYKCALAICSTFCSQIAPALIPLFGPSFPSQCVPVEAPEHGRMIIDSAIVTAAAAQAESYRLQYSQRSSSTGFPTPISSASSTMTYSPSLSELSTPYFAPARLGRRLRLGRAFGTESERDTDAGSETSGSGDGYFCSPGSRPARQPWMLNAYEQNMRAYNANSAINISNPSTILSAIPRSTTEFALKPSTPPMHGRWRKRRLEEGEADDEYDSASGGSEKSVSDVVIDGQDGGHKVEERRAAWLLMKLSVGDMGNPGEASHRGKRKRASSM